jgi:Rad52/22 family double-strand break repair protein
MTPESLLTEAPATDEPLLPVVLSPDPPREGARPAPVPKPAPHATIPLLPATLTCRSITAIVAELSRPLPDICVAMKTVKGTQIRYLHWQTVARLLDAYAPGWNGEVTRLEQHGATLRVTYRVYIPCDEGVVWREATGEDDEWEATEETRYGNPSANAQANAFKRAAALFGVGQWLYDKPQDPTAKGLAEYLRQEKQATIIDLGKALIDKGMDRKEALDWLKTKAGVTSIDQVPITAIKTMLSYVIETPKLDDDLSDIDDAWLTEAEKRRKHQVREDPTRHA